MLFTAGRYGGDRTGAPAVQEVLREARYLDVDLEQRDRVAALDPDLDLVRIHRDVLADRRKNVLVKNGNEVGIPGAPRSCISKTWRRC